MAIVVSLDFWDCEDYVGSLDCVESGGCAQERPYTSCCKSIVATGADDSSVSVMNSWSRVVKLPSNCYFVAAADSAAVDGSRRCYCC